MVQDIRKAYFFAPATRKVYIELPPEDHEQGKVGLLMKSLYGTRDAALNWTAAYTSVLVNKMNFVQGKSTPCAFYHEKWQIRTLVHGDDFVSEGPEKNLLAMDEMLRKEFEVKTEILGPEKRHVQQVKILNRVVSWEDDGIVWEPDPRHAELIISQLGLENAKPLKLPGIKEEPRTERQERLLEDEVEMIYSMKDGEIDDDNNIERESVSAIAAKQEYIDFKMRDGGWNLVANGKWEKALSGIRRLPMPPVGGARRRIVKDMDSGATVDDIQLVSRVESRKIHRYLKRKTNIMVEVEVDDVNGIEANDWEQQEMANLDATQ